MGFDDTKWNAVDREIEATKIIDHPFIVKYIQGFEDEIP